MVFVHGNLSDCAVWDEQIGLLPAGYRGIAVDLRGFGRSDVAPIDATNRLSAVWGQPRLTKYLRWKSTARRERRHETRIAAVS